MVWRLMQYNLAYDRFMGECDQEIRDSIKSRLVQVMMRGNLCGPPVSEPLGSGLFEIKARNKKVRVRLLYGFLPGKRVVILWGGTKDQRRLPPETLRHAREILRQLDSLVERISDITIH